MRYHSLDALRAAMMLLGVVLHSAASYTRSPLGDAWPFKDAHTSVIFDAALMFIHAFRMPVFFVAAGFFAALLYERDGPAGLAWNRAKRVLVPLIVFGVTVSPLAGLGFLFAARHSDTVVAAVFTDLTAGPILRRPVLGHLWFLYDLLIFYAAALLIVPAVSRLPAAWRCGADALFGRLLQGRWTALLAGVISAVTLLPMAVPAFETSVALLPPLRVPVAYGVFFLFGWMLFRRRDALESTGRGGIATLAAGVVPALLLLIAIVRQTPPHPRLAHAAGCLFVGIATWALVLAIVGAFVRHVRRERPLVRYLSDASYWVYLVHLPLTIWIPALLAGLPLHAVVKFALTLAGTTLVSLATYHYLVRGTQAGVMLNGRRYRVSVAGNAPRSPAL